MTTKEQERDALKKIEAILATLDHDGWVNIAFEGCIEDAKSNIEYDFGDSWKSRADFYKKRCAEIDREKDDMRIARDQMKSERDAALSCVDKVEAENANLRARIAALEKDCKGTDAERAKAACSLQAKTDELKAARDEITRLKARLFDLLCAEG